MINERRSGGKVMNLEFLEYITYSEGTEIARGKKRAEHLPPNTDDYRRPTFPPTSFFSSYFFFY